MALSECTTQTDLHDQELAKHGDPSFPIACYADDLSLLPVPWHWHEEWEYAIVTEGCGEFRVENHRILLSEGEGIFINGKALHSVYDESHSLKLHSAVFHPRLIGGNTDSYFWSSLVTPLTANPSLRYLILRPDTAWQHEVLEHFRKTWDAIAYEPDNYPNITRFELSSAIHILIQHADLEKMSLSTQELSNANRIRILLEYIEAHYHEEISVSSLAEAISASESVVLRCFRQMLHTSPMQYVKNIRLKKAADLLHESNKSAKEIALICGFNDISYFTRAFKEVYHLTPGEYRRSNRQF